MLAGFQLDTGLGKALNMLGDHIGAAAVNGVEHIFIGHQAEALVPGKILGGKVLVDIVVFAQLLAHLANKKAFGDFGKGLRHLKQHFLKQNISGPRNGIGPACRQDFTQTIGKPVFGGAGNHIGGRALQHGDLLGFVGHGG